MKEGTNIVANERRINIDFLPTNSSDSQLGRRTPQIRCSFDPCNCLTEKYSLHN